jgi:Mn2+/Fe2+ NRAMP family transporter
LTPHIGCIVQVFIAAGIIVCGAALFGHMQNASSTGPSDIINSLHHVVGRWPAILFGIGLFDAGFLASITVSLSSSWSISELFGWSKSLNDKISESPKFYDVYIGSLVLAALAILIPNLPLNLISIITQFVGGILMAPLLIFLVIMTSTHGRVQNQGIWPNMGLANGYFAHRIDSSDRLADVHSSLSDGETVPGCKTLLLRWMAPSDTKPNTVQTYGENNEYRFMCSS